MREVVQQQLFHVINYIRQCCPVAYVSGHGPISAELVHWYINAPHTSSLTIRIYTVYTIDKAYGECIGQHNRQSPLAQTRVHSTCTLRKDIQIVRMSHPPKLTTSKLSTWRPYGVHIKTICRLPTLRHAYQSRIVEPL